jgi:hypothetical protein
VFEQAVQIFGAVLILLAYALATTGRLEQKALAYILLNLAGSAILAALAAIDGNLDSCCSRALGR